MKKLFSLVTLASVLFLHACQHEPPNPIKAPTNPAKAPKKGPSTSSARIATHVSPVNYLTADQVGKQKLLVIAGDNLYAVDAGTRTVQHLATGFSGTEVLSWAGTSATGDYLLYTQSDHLYRYSPFTGEHVMFGSGWYGTEHMTSTGAGLIAIHQGAMYGTSYTTGHATYYGDGWNGTVDLSFSAPSPSNSSYRTWGIQGGNEWGISYNYQIVSTRALHGLTSAYITRINSAGSIMAYYVYGSQLKSYNVYGSNPVAITDLGTTNWSGTTAMSYAGGHIWILKSGIIYQVNPTTGQVVGTVNIPGAYIIESFACNC